jgi:hypothetical protein
MNDFCAAANVSLCVLVLSLSLKHSFYFKIEITVGLYRALDGVANLKYKLFYFLTPNKKNFKEKGTSF